MKEKKWLKKINNRRINPLAYDEFKNDVYQYNLSAITNLSLIGMIGGAILFIVSLPPFRILTLVEAYGSLMMIFIVFYIVAKTALKKYNKAIMPVYYLLIVLLLALGIVMGTVMGRNTNATTFLMLSIVVRFFIIDKPYRLNIVIGIMCVIFCLVVNQVGKVGNLASLDIANCLVFYIFGVIVTHQSIHGKMSDIIIKRELKKQVDTDTLTQLSNRGAFERVVEKYVHESNKDAIMMIMDIDHFKTVNDVMGHAYGDMVLQLVGEYLKSTFRNSDIVSRLGGDEFVAFLPYADDVKAITDKVTKLIDEISAIKVESETPCKIGASVGLAFYPEDGCSFEELYKQADKALYYAKEHGKGQYAIYDEKIMGN